MVKQNILVSHNQITVRSIPYDQEKQEWTERNLKDGMIWRYNYIVLDPLVDDSFGCWFLIDKNDKVVLEESAIRAALIPFEISNKQHFSINTVSESIILDNDTDANVNEEKAKGKYFPLKNMENLFFSNGKYDLLFEICLGIPDDSVNEEEVFYKFTFIPNEKPVFKVLKDDDYGWSSETALNIENGNLENVNPIE